MGLLKKFMKKKYVIQICNLVVGEKGKICGKIDLKKRFWIEDIDTIS